MTPGEQVFSAPRRALFPNGTPQGFFRPPKGMWRTILGRGSFRPRAQLEEDPSQKQIIPYAVVVCRDALFCFRRKRGGGESRLFGLRSIGVGGHINPSDGQDCISGGLRRELEEELFLPAARKTRWVGFINDDSTAVGSVHLGVVALVETDSDSVRVKERDTMSGGFLRRTELESLHARERESFETWSALLLDRIDEVFACTDWPDSCSTTPRETPTSST